MTGFLWFVIVIQFLVILFVMLNRRKTLPTDGSLEFTQVDGKMIVAIDLRKNGDTDVDKVRGQKRVVLDVVDILDDGEGRS